MRSITLEFERLEAALRDAQEAAEEYWEAWQDALRRGDSATLDAAYEQTRRQLAEENAAKGLEFRANMEREWVQMKAERDRLEKAAQLGEGHYLTLQREAEVTRERDRLREALKRYGRHLGDCAAVCGCGLSDLVA